MLTKVDQLEAEQARKWLIHQNNRGKLWWDMYTTALILYVAVTIPMQLGETSRN
jgi:hypothetical protein